MNKPIKVYSVNSMTDYVPWRLYFKKKDAIAYLRELGYHPIGHKFWGKDKSYLENNTASFITEHWVE